MATVLQTIAQEGLETDVNEVIGAEFLSAVRDVQPRYEAMVRERLRRDKAAGQNLFETIRALQAAIVNYAGKVIGSIEHDDPATVETARLALLPISNHRDAVAAAQRAGKSASAAATAGSGGRGDSRGSGGEARRGVRGKRRGPPESCVAGRAAMRNAVAKRVLHPAALPRDSVPSTHCMTALKSTKIHRRPGPSCFPGFQSCSLRRAVTRWKRCG